MKIYFLNVQIHMDLLKIVSLFILLLSGFFNLMLGQELIKDIEECQDGSNIKFLQSNGEIAVFIATTDESGEEVYISDGTYEGTELLADLTTGPQSTDIWESDLLGDSLFLVSFDGEQGLAKVWLVDIQTGQFQNLLTYEVSGFSSQSSGHFVRVGDVFYFTLRNKNYQFELWETDGTSANSRKVGLLPNNSFPRDLIEFKGMLYFILKDGDNGDAIWSYNGLYAFQWFNSSASSMAGYIGDLTVFDDELVFAAYDPEYGVELYRSDGASNNVSLLYERDMSLVLKRSVSNLTLFDNSLYYIDRIDSTHYGIVKQDSLNSLPKFLVDTRLDSEHSLIRDLITTENYIAFTNYSDGKSSIWISKGDSINTYPIITDLYQGGLASYSGLKMSEYNGVLFFNVLDSLHGEELWINDGSSNEASILKDIQPGVVGSKPNSIQKVGGGVLFISDNCEYGSELWVSDGQSQNTEIVKDLKFSGKGSFPSKGIVIGDDLFFVAHSEEFGSELYVSDGTESGTYLLRDIHPGEESSNPSDFAILSGKLYFIAESENWSRNIYVTDGTPSGTKKISDVRAQNHLVSFNGYLFADLFSIENGTELWMSDGTEEGTSLLKDINIGLSGSHPWITSAIYNDELYFSAHDGIHGQELWKTDGTPEGTILVKSIDFYNNSPTHHNYHLGHFYNFKEHLYFRANHYNFGAELWRTDGTTFGTELVRDVAYGQTSGLNWVLGSDSTHLYFSGRNNYGTELWKTDGSSEGTEMVVDLNSGSSSSFPGNFVSIGDKFVFTATNQSTGDELYISDGTELGTKLLKDIYPGEKDSYPRYFLKYNDIVLFNAKNETHGRSLWKSDGTVEGTKLLSFNNSLENGSDPLNLFVFKNDVFLTLDDLDFGRELWKLRNLCLSPFNRSVDMSFGGANMFSAENAAFVSGGSELDNLFQVNAGEYIEVLKSTSIELGGVLELNIKECNE